MGRPLVIPPTPTADNLITLLKTATAGLLQTKIIPGTRILATATGDVAYTGMGFKPTALLAVHAVGGSNTFGMGFADSSGGPGQAAWYGAGLATASALGLMVCFQSDGAANKYQLATVKSYDADGFTLTWTESAVPPTAGTVTFFVLGIR